MEGEERKKRVEGDEGGDSRGGWGRWRGEGLGAR